MAALAVVLSLSAWSQGTDVDFRGTVVDQNGSPVSGASVKLLESDLAATTDAQGIFSLKGTLAIGAIHRTRLPGDIALRYRDGILSLSLPIRDPVRAEWISPRGRVLELTGGAGSGAGGSGERRTLRYDLDRLAGGKAGVHWLRIGSSGGSAIFRFTGLGAGGHGVLTAGTSPRGAMGAGTAASPAKISAVASVPYVLEVSAAGFFPKRFSRPASAETGLILALLPSTTGLKARIQDFIGAGNTFRLAFLKLEAPGSRKYVLYHTDFEEMAGDTMPQHAFPDSRGPNTTVYGAFAPSWSPDGRTLAYELGWENQTTPVSRIYLQPIGGARIDGPGVPATNPRWWTDGKDTSLIWCSSGNADGAWDSSSSTFRQKVSGGSLTGDPEVLSRGSFNAGLSPDGRYLATAYRFAAMRDLKAGPTRSLHVYPGHPPASDGFSTDSLQACNGSVSNDPAHPSRMLFLDFGVPDEPSYPNLVTPKLYAQHRMILIGDYASDAPGRIVDFIDTPAAELALENTWDDPEWTNAPDFAVASTRDPDGDKSVPSEPKPSQPDIYLINLVTKESIKVLSGTDQVLPAAWIGPR